MKREVKVLQKIIARKGPSKTLTFSIPHILKAIQLLSKEKFVSRSNFCSELYLGEGAVKTLIRRLKEENLADTTKAGTYLTPDGKKIAVFFEKTIPYEYHIQSSKTVTKKHNHAILLRGYANSIKTGIEQRDYAILYGSEGCLTLLYKNENFIFPSDDKEALYDDVKTKRLIEKNLHPKEGDVIIISSSNDSFVAEISAKNSALATMANH